MRRLAALNQNIALKQAQSATPYEWFEFTPWAAGSVHLDSFVPTWAFGRKFLRGISVNSAFCAKFDRVLEEMKLKFESPMVQGYIPKLENSQWFETVGTKHAVPPALFRNPTYMLRGTILHQKRIELMDAGLDYNLPFPPLLERRHADVVIAVDASEDIAGAPALLGAELYAKRKNLPFPPIDYAEASRRPFSIFRDTANPHCPVVIYLPLVKNPAFSESFDPFDIIQKGGYLRTFNSVYTDAQFDELFGLARHNVLEAAPVIQETLRSIIGSWRQSGSQLPQRAMPRPPVPPDVAFIEGKVCSVPTVAWAEVPRLSDEDAKVLLGYVPVWSPLTLELEQSFYMPEGALRLRNVTLTPCRVLGRRAHIVRIDMTEDMLRQSPLHFIDIISDIDLRGAGAGAAGTASSAAAVAATATAAAPVDAVGAACAACVAAVSIAAAAAAAAPAAAGAAAVGASAAKAPAASVVGAAGADARSAAMTPPPAYVGVDVGGVLRVELERTEPMMLDMAEALAPAPSPGINDAGAAAGAAAASVVGAGATTAAGVAAVAAATSATTEVAAVPAAAAPAAQ